MTRSPNISNWTLSHRIEHDRDGSRLAYLTVEVAIAIAGLLANIVVVATILSSKKLRSVNYHLILNLSFSDIGILLFTFPFAVNVQERGNWPEFVCLGIFPFSDIFQGVSFWTITAIAISRYRAVQGDFNIRKNTLLKTKVLIGSIWLFSLALVSVPLIVFMKHLRSPTEDYCYPRFPILEGHERYFLKKIYVFTIRITLNYVLPLAIIAATYIAIAVHISRGIRQLQSIVSNEGFTGRDLRGIRIRLALKRNHRAKRFLSPLVLVFSISALPFNILRVLQFIELDISRYQAKIAYVVCVVFLLSYCAINPVIYCIVNTDFYREMKQMLHRVWSGIQKALSIVFNGFSQTQGSMQLNTIERND